MLFRSYKKVNQTQEAIELVASFFHKSHAEKLIWIFDKPVSNSGRIKQIIMDFAIENNLNWNVELEFNPDKFLAENAEILVTSDAWILDHCKRWFNLIGYLIQEESLSANVIKMC
mgnify:FL=1